MSEYKDLPEEGCKLPCEVVSAWGVPAVVVVRHDVEDVDVRNDAVDVVSAVGHFGVRAHRHREKHPIADGCGKRMLFSFQIFILYQTSFIGPLNILC